MADPDDKDYSPDYIEDPRNYAQGYLSQLSDTWNAAKDWLLNKPAQGFSYLAGLDPFNINPGGQGTRLDVKGNVHAPALTENLPPAILHSSPLADFEDTSVAPLLNNVIKGGVGLADSPVLGAAMSNPAVALGMAPGMLADTASHIGKLRALKSDQGKSWDDPEVTGTLGDLISSAGMSLLAARGLPEQAHAVAEGFPEFSVGGDYTSRSPVTMGRTIEPSTSSMVNKPADSAWLHDNHGNSDLPDIDPIKVYHGTLSEGGLRPEPGLHVGTAEQASKKMMSDDAMLGSLDPEMKGSELEGGRVYPLEITPKKVADISDIGPDFDFPLKLAGELTNKGVISPSEAEGLYSKQNIYDLLRSKGIDALKYPNEYEGTGDSYLVTNPDIISSGIKPPTPQGPKPINLGDFLPFEYSSDPGMFGGNLFQGGGRNSSKGGDEGGSNVEEPSPNPLHAGIKQILDSGQVPVTPEFRDILLNEAANGDPNGHVANWLDIQTRKQRSRTGVSKTAPEVTRQPAPENAITPLAEPPTQKSGLVARQQELLDKFQAQNPDSDIADLASSLIKKPAREMTGSVTESSALTATAKEKKAPLKPYSVLLDDGSTHTIRATDPDSAVELAQNKLSDLGSVKEVNEVRDKLGSLEAAGSTPMSKRDIGMIEAISKAQDLEDIKTQKTSAQEAEKAAKADDRANTKAANQRYSFKVTLDDGQVHYVQAKDAADAKEFAQDTLDRGTTGLKVANVEPRLSSLEKAAAGQGKPPKPPGPPNKRPPGYQEPGALKFEKFDAVANFFDKLSGGLKSSIMSTGIPGTGVSPHGASTLHRAFGSASYTTLADNPISASAKALKYIFVPDQASKFISANKADAARYEAIKPGFSSPTEYNEPKNIFAEAHHAAFGKPLFEKIIPALKIEKAQTMERYYLKQGMKPDAAASKAVDDASVAFGGLKNWSKSRFNRIALFAPDWLETNARIGTGVAKAMMNPTAPEGKMYRAFLANTIMMYGLKNAIQYGLTGTPSTSNTLGKKEDIKFGKEGEKDLYIRPEGTGADWARIPLEVAESVGMAIENKDPKYLKQLSSIVTNRLSPLKVLANFLMNEDYKGDPLWGMDKYGRSIPMWEDTVGPHGGVIPSTKSRITDELEGALPQPVGAIAKLIQGRSGPIEAIGKSLGLPISARNPKYNIENIGPNGKPRNNSYSNLPSW